MRYQKAPVFLILGLSISCIGLLQYHRSSRPIDVNVSATEPKPHSESTDSISNTRRQQYNVRHCISDRILGKAKVVLDTNVPFEVSDETSPEIGENRKASFEDIFKNKVWILPGEGVNEKQASGNDISMFLGLPTGRVLKGRYRNIHLGLHYSVRKIIWCPYLLAFA